MEESLEGETISRQAAKYRIREPTVSNLGDIVEEESEEGTRAGSKKTAVYLTYHEYSTFHKGAITPDGSYYAE